MRARFIFGCLALVAACKRHDDPTRGLAPGPSGSAATPSDALIARLGEHGGSVYPEQLVARDDGGLVLLAHVVGKTRIGDVEVAQTGEYHEPTVVVAFDADGHIRWAHPFVICSEDTLHVAVHGTQTVVAGGCPGRLDAPYDPAVKDFEHVQIGVLDDKGALVWQKQAGEPGANNEARSLAIGDDGTIFVGGVLRGPADLGRGRIDVAKRTQTGFVAAYAPDGNPLWVTAVPHAEVQAVVSGGDEIDIAGGYNQTAQLGATQLTAPHGGRFVARLAKTTGEARSAVTIGENASLYLALARAPSGTLYVAYDHDRDDADVLMSIDGANQPKELHRYRSGPAMTLGVRSLAIDATGAVWLASAFDKQVDFGSGAIKAVGNFDPIVAKYRADGALLATSSPLATITDESIDGLALTKAGPVVAIRSLAGPPGKPYSEWLVTETYGVTSLVRVAP